MAGGMAVEQNDERYTWICRRPEPGLLGRSSQDAWAKCQRILPSQSARFRGLVEGGRFLTGRPLQARPAKSLGRDFRLKHQLASTGFHHSATRPSPMEEWSGVKISGKTRAGTRLWGETDARLSAMLRAQNHVRFRLSK